MDGTNNYRIEGQASPATQDPYRRLAAGILAHAAKEARAGDPDAVIWLLSEQAQFLTEAVEISYTHVQSWARERLQVV